MDARVTSQEVRRIAALARLRLQAGLEARLASDLDAILAHAETLGRLPLDGVEPMTRPFDHASPLAPDEPGETLAPGALGALTPHMDGPFIRVPKVISGGSSA